MENLRKPIYRFILLGLCLALWLSTHSFTGVMHDGVFYALQALHIMQPEAFKHDIFFLYGSQDQYTIFSNLYATAIKNFGMARGTILLEILGLVLWLLAAWVLVRILPEVPAIVALLLIITLDNYYGSHRVFGYAEHYLTARLYAELFALAGLAAYLNQRYFWGTLAYALAFLMHPLIALPVFIIGLGIWLRPIVWLMLLVAGGVMGILLGIAGIHPFTGLIQPMDDTWWQYNVGRSPFVFLHTWTWSAFSQVLLTIAITTAAGLMLSETKLKRLAWTVLASVLALLTVSWVGASLLKLPLLIGLQLHRVMWIAIVINPLLLTAIAWESRQASKWHIILAVGLSIGLLLDSNIQGGYAIAIVLISLAGYHYAPHYQPSRWLWVLLAVIPLQALIFSLLNLDMDTAGNAYISSKPTWRIYLGHPLTALALFAGLYWLTHCHSQIAKAATIIITTGLLGWTGWNWHDSQTIHINNTAETFYDSPARQAAIAPIKEIIPPNAMVYWIEAPEKAWFWLQRANYVSFQQAAGSIFNRGTAIELIRRTRHIAQASDLDSRNTWDSCPTTKDKKLTAPILQQLCQDKIIDYVIAKNYQTDIKVLYFNDPDTKQRYGLYTCRGKNPTLLNLK